MQQEQISKLTCMEPGLIRADVSVKAFGWDGQPQRSEQSIIFSNIVEPFQPTNNLGDYDLRTMFRDFLIAHHLENLVPNDLEK